MPKKLTKTTDLTAGTFWNQYDDGSATLRNCDKGLRIDLTAQEVDRLREMVLSGEAAEAGAAA